MGLKKDKFDAIVETVPLLDVGETTKVVIKLEDKDEDDLFFEDQFKEVTFVLYQSVICNQLYFQFLNLCSNSLLMQCH